MESCTSLESCCKEVRGHKNGLKKFSHKLRLYKVSSVSPESNSCSESFLNSNILFCSYFYIINVPEQLLKGQPSLARLSSVNRSRQLDAEVNWYQFFQIVVKEAAGSLRRLLHPAQRVKERREQRQMSAAAICTSCKEEEKMKRNFAVLQKSETRLLTYRSPPGFPPPP